MNQVLNPEALGEPKGYSNGIAVPSGARTLFIAGQVGWDRTHRFEEGFLAQFERALDNVLEVVRAAGGSPEHVARMTIYVTDKKLYLASVRELGAVWRSRFGKWYPAMTLVQVSSLLEDRALLEIEATAGVP
jgi:enamine deaminase RidA (YjgF/YER057c/UK114 family)